MHESLCGTPLVCACVCVHGRERLCMTPEYRNHAHVEWTRQDPRAVMQPRVLPVLPGFLLM